MNLGESTFDGIHKTNGYHPLWLVSLLPIFTFEFSDINYLRVIGVYNTLLLGLAGFLALNFLFKEFSNFTASASFLVFLYFLRYFYDGMETSLLIPLMIISFILIFKYQILLLNKSKSNIYILLIIGILLSFMQLSRLDSVFVNILLFMYILKITYHDRDEAKKINNFYTDLLFWIICYFQFSVFWFFCTDFWINKINE